MNDIIDKLTEIETIAKRIKDSVAVQKQELAEEMEAQQKAFDDGVDADNRVLLARMRQGLEIKMQKELAALQEKQEKDLQELDAYYEAYHERLAEQLFQKILRM